MRLGGRYLRPLAANRDYRLYFAANLVSNFGSWMQNTALYWLVLRITGSGSALGALSLCLYGPVLVFGLLGGALADRVGPRRVLLGTQIGLAVAALLLFLLSVTGSQALLPVLGLSLARGFIICINAPSRQAFLASVVQREDLSSAISLNASAWNASRILGPSVAGLVIAWSGVNVCFALNAVSYIGVIGVLFAIRPTRGAEHAEPRAEKTGRDLWSGLRYIRGQPYLTTILLAFIAVSFISISFAVLIPIFAFDRFHQNPSAYGFLSSALGLGALLGATFAGAMEERGIFFIFASAAGLGVAELLMGAAHGFVIASLLLVVAGFFNTCFLTTINTILLFDSPKPLHGRVAAVYQYVNSGLSPLGSAVSGWIAEAGGIGAAFATGGAIALTISVLGLARTGSMTRQRQANIVT
jgi:MFS family permease